MICRSRRRIEGVRLERGGAMYEKIAALIARNDFHTAEKLLKKHDMLLTQEQKEALRKLAETQLRENQRAARKSEKNMKRIKRWGKHGLMKLSLKIKLGKGILAGLILFVPYLKNKIYAWPEKFEIMPMEILLLAYLLVVVLFCALGFMDAHTHKISSYEAKQRVRDPNKKWHGLFRTFQDAERKFAEDERNWLAALIFFGFWSVVQLWHVFSMNV